MHFTTLLLTSTLALATPITPSIPSTDTLDTRAAKVQPLIDAWADKNFLGLKFTGERAPGGCFDFPSNFQSLLTSAKARPGFVCTVWVDKACKGTGFSFDKNGEDKFPAWIDNKAKSWKCKA